MGKHPYIVPVAGSDDFMVRRYVAEWTRFLEGSGYKTAYCAAGDLGSELSTMGLVDEKRHIVLDTPDIKADSSVLFPEIPGTVVTLVFGDKIPKKWEELLKPYKAHKFEDVPPYKQVERATSFLEQELERQGLQMAPDLQRAMISKAGTDRGVLAFEVWKVKILAAPKTQITVDLLSGSLASLVDADIDPLMDAMKSRSGQKMFRAIQAIRNTSSVDPTIKICRYALEIFIPILQACSCVAQGMSDDDAASACRVHVWVYKNKIRQVAASLGEKHCSNLIHILVDTERDVKRGSQRPLLLLESRLLQWGQA